MHYLAISRGDKIDPLALQSSIFRFFGPSGRRPKMMFFWQTRKREGKSAKSLGLQEEKGEEQETY
jgi:hypothetical protein